MQTQHSAQAYWLKFTALATKTKAQRRNSRWPDYNNIILELVETKDLFFLVAIR